MYNQRIVRRSSLRRINLFRCLRVQRIRPQSVYRLRRKCHQLSRADQITRLFHGCIVYIRRIYLNNLCLHIIRLSIVVPLRPSYALSPDLLYSACKTASLL